VPEWINWILENKPEIHIIHLVRHPLGFINSWYNRYFASRDPEKTKAINVDRLRRIKKFDPSWTLPWDSGKEDEFSNKELELWYWRYANEALLTSGAKNASYNFVTYSELTHNTEKYLKKYYDLLSLEYSDKISKKILDASKKSASLSEKWKEDASEEDLALAERILDGSPLKEFFSSK
jgi:hypothetical protein